MEFEQSVAQYHKEKARQVHNAVSVEECQHIICRYREVQNTSRESAFLEALFPEMQAKIFTTELKQFFSLVFGGDYLIQWPRFDVIDDNAIDNYYSTRWHRDGGLKEMVKVFVYLNAVSEHDCNTLYYDEVRSKALREAGALPLDMDKRHLDVSDFLERLGMNTIPSEFELGAGDLLIFNPLKLAHQCRPPKTGHRRYTICYTVFPTG